MGKIAAVVTIIFAIAIGRTANAACTIGATIDGAISPATLDFIERAQHRADEHQCGSILLLINTPGGNLQTTRLIVEKILSSDKPFLCLVHPAGAHAGSAGAIILQACHVAGAVHTTNIGAATPISSTGENIPEDLRKKILNDTRAWVEGLAHLRGRSEKFARDIIDEAVAVTAEEALKLKAIDFVGNTLEDFLKFAEGRKISLKEGAEPKALEVGELIVMPQDLRYKVLDVLMNPEVAYLMFMGSLGLLYFEVTHPGMVLPGVVGGVGLVISLVSLHMLDVKWGGILLILLGLGFLIAEAFVAGFGVLGLGGIISFFIGSLFLFDPEKSGYSLALSTILPTTLVLGLLMSGIAYLAYSTRKRRRQGGFDDLLHREGKVVEVQDSDPLYGQVEIAGEIWRCTSDDPLKVGSHVIVKRHSGLTLHVATKTKGK